MDRPVDKTSFLPDFCSLQVLFAVVLLAELFALILTFAAIPGSSLIFWRELAFTSLFVQFCALASTLTLCLLTRPLAHASAVRVAAIAYLAVLLVILLCSQLTLTFDAYFLPGLIGRSADAFILRNLLIGALVGAIALRYFYIQHQWKRQLEIEHNARIEALQARIRPHFLFNSMNTIASLIRQQPEIAEEAVEDLADLFRASLGDGRKLVPLAEELALAHMYARIEALRLGDRLRLRWQTDELPQDALIPPLTLQPLLENAIYHGIEPLPGGGEVVVAGSVDGQTLQLVLENPRPTVRRDSGNRMAQENVRERLSVHFGAAATLAIDDDGTRYRLTVRIPLRKGPAR